MKGKMQTGGYLLLEVLMSLGLLALAMGLVLGFWDNMEKARWRSEAELMGLELITNWAWISGEVKHQTGQGGWYYVKRGEWENEDIGYVFSRNEGFFLETRPISLKLKRDGLGWLVRTVHEGQVLTEFGLKLEEVD